MHPLIRMFSQWSACKSRPATKTQNITSCIYKGLFESTMFYLARRLLSLQANKMNSPTIKDKGKQMSDPTMSVSPLLDPSPGISHSLNQPYAHIDKPELTLAYLEKQAKALGWLPIEHNYTLLQRIADCKLQFPMDGKLVPIEEGKGVSKTHLYKATLNADVYQQCKEEARQVFIKYYMYDVHTHTNMDLGSYRYEHLIHRLVHEKVYLGKASPNVVPLVGTADPCHSNHFARAGLHPNLQGGSYIVSRFAQHGSVYQMFQAGGKDMVEIIFQILFTTACLERLGLNHNDLHIKNIVIDNYVCNGLEKVERVYSTGTHRVHIVDPILPRLFDFDRAQSKGTINPYYTDDPKGVMRFSRLRDCTRILIDIIAFWEEGERIPKLWPRLYQVCDYFYFEGGQDHVFRFFFHATDAQFAALYLTTPFKAGETQSFFMSPPENLPPPNITSTDVCNVFVNHFRARLKVVDGTTPATYTLP